MREEKHQRVPAQKPSKEMFPRPATQHRTWPWGSQSAVMLTSTNFKSGWDKTLMGIRENEEGTGSEGMNVRSRYSAVKGSKKWGNW